MSRLEKLIVQTTFLLEKQDEITKECFLVFKDFLSFIEGKIKDFNEEPETVESLEKIHDMISGHTQQISCEAKEDYDFLREQLGALKKIATITDAAKAKEILNTLIDEDEKLIETEDFKKNVLQDTADAKKSLLAMIDDITESLNDGDVKKVELLIETMVNEEEDDDEEDDLENSENFSDDCTPGNCGDCSLDCSETAGNDIFSMVSQDDNELEEDLDKTKKSKTNIEN